MDAPHRNDAAGGVTLTPDARDLARLAGLRDDLEPTRIEVADARSTARPLRANLAALDLLGWPS